MRFAYNPHFGAITPDVLAWVARMQGRACRVSALIDGSMLQPQDMAWLENSSLDVALALAGSPFAAYGRQGPLLWALDTADAGKRLQAWLRRTDGIPALSFIASPAGARPLGETLIWLALAHTDDGQRLHCRFADTRILPALLACLCSEQRAVLAASIAEWAWLARDATLQAKLVGPAPQEAEAPVPLTLDAAQFAFLLTRAEPDVVFQMLVERLPELLPDAPGAALHGRIERLLGAAREHGLEELPDLFQYVVVALCTRDDFDRHPALQPTWQRLRKEGGSFAGLAAQWPDALLQALAEAPQAAHPAMEKG